MDDSSLILNEDGTTYHLGINEDSICENIITVGDPERIDSLIPHLSEIHNQSSNREFRSVKGKIRGHDVLMISTGMGTDNIEICLTELDMLANPHKYSQVDATSYANRSLNLIRLGTSGARHVSLELDQVIYSKQAFSLDNQHIWYPLDSDASLENKKLIKALKSAGLPDGRMVDASYLPSFINELTACTTYTANGFYRNQLRFVSKEDTLSLGFDALETLVPIHNIEMETAGLYRLAQYFGHKALSVSTILAQRKKGSFSKDPSLSVNNMINSAMESLF